MHTCSACVVQGPDTAKRVSNEKGGSDGDSGVNDSSHIGHDSPLDLHPLVGVVRSKKPFDTVRVQGLDIRLACHCAHKHIVPGPTYAMQLQCDVAQAGHIDCV